MVESSEDPSLTTVTSNSLGRGVPVSYKVQCWLFFSGIGLRVGNVIELRFLAEMEQKDPQIMEYLKVLIKVSTIIEMRGTVRVQGV